MAISQITGNSIANSTITLDDLNFNPVPSNGSINVGQLDTVYSNGVGGMVIPGGEDTFRPTVDVANGTLRFNSTNNTMQLYANNDWNTFSTVGSSFVVEYVAVGGGGGGGNFGGGGGGGGVLSTTFTAFSGDIYEVVIGGGGIGHPGSPSGFTPGLSTAQGANGSSTTISSLGVSALGGGGGGGNNPTTVAAQSGFSGGSGGGASNQNATGVAGLGTPGQGFAGGAGTGSANNNKSGGGGGSGQVGYAGSAPANTSNGGDGTTSYSALIIGAAINVNGHISGGGGGAGTGAPSSLGGAGGGGDRGQSGTTNTGGGGGGANAPSLSGSGGSGLVIFRYVGSTKATGGTITSSGGYTYHKFTTSGSFIIS